VTNPDGYTLAYGYDNLDRRVQITYPDASTEQTVYDLLDAGRTKDRLNRWTLMTYNPIRQLTDVQDPQGRMTHLNWCGCGSLESLVDPMGRITAWVRDLEGRVTAKIYPDLTQTTYAYDGAGRLAQRTDAKSQITSYGYFIDDDLKSVTYSNTVIPTPPASYTYDPRYNRLASSTGVLGTTSYTYNPMASIPALGATRLASVLSPMPNSAITYGYDELGRVVNRSINGVAETRNYDALGRIATVTNPLGQFTYTYDGATNRLLSVLYPNGQTTAFTYFDNAGDKRLKAIQNNKSTGANISTFSYTYDPTGQIQSWTQTADAQTPKAYTYSYDAVGQLLGATLKDTATSQILKTYVYGYDDAGNRTTEQINGAITTSNYSNLNQLTGQSFSPTPSFASPAGGPAPQSVTPLPGRVGSRSPSQHPVHH
jgi:YD repeat-containing protein